MSTSIISNAISAVSNAIKSIDNETNCITEQKDMEEVSYASQKVGIEEETDETSDYDPKDDEPQGIKDEEEDLAELEEEEEDLSEEEEVEEEAGEDVIDSEEFQQEWKEAMAAVSNIAHAAREQILRHAKQEYFEETGKEATDEMVQKAFNAFDVQTTDEDEEDTEEEEEEEVEEEELLEVDPVSFRAEFAEALEIVRKTAKADQETLVNDICDASMDLFGAELSVEELSNIFGRIKNEFAEEAKEDFLEFYQAPDDNQDSDSDYDLNNEQEDDDEDNDDEYEEVSDFDEDAQTLEFDESDDENYYSDEIVDID